MKLNIVETYQLDGKTFVSLKEAQTHLENEIGKILDSTPLRTDSAQALAVFNAIVKNKDRLCQLLSVEIEAEDWSTPARNLLDMNL